MIYPANKDEKTMINLTVVIDNDEAVKKLKELQNVAKTTTSSVVKDSERMDASWQQMKNSLMSLTAGISFAALTKQVVQVRGEVQQLEVAFETMLGSKEKADTLMTEIIDLAAKTPFGLQDVSNATKMLLAYGSTAEQVTDEIKMLGNIASGLSIPLNDMIYLYGTTRTQGRMFTQDLRQFMGRGIPLAEELAKQFGVTKDKVGELVTAGKVGFDEMAKALQAMTSEGGKFNNLMDKQSQTIAGQISNLEDAIYQMFNEIGESSEGVISDLISGASWVVEHYQEILNVLKYVIAAYGSYRAALILVAGAQKALALAESTAGLLKMTSAARGLSIALKGLTAAAGPIGLIVSVLGIAVTAFTSYNRKTEEATEQMGKLEKAAYDEYIEVNRLVSRLHDANLSESERNSILNRLKTVAPDILQGISDEANMTAQLTANLKDYNDEQERRIQLAALNDRMEGELKKVGDAEIKKAEAELALNNLISDYNARRRTLWTPTLQYSTELKGSGVRYSPSDKQRKEIEAEITKALDDILGDVHTTDAYKALKIEDYLSKTHSIGGLQYNVSGIEGFDIKNVIAKVDNANKNLNEAKKSFDTYINEDKQLREILGVVSNKTEGSAGDALTYAEAYKAAQKNYIDTQKALADAEKNKSNYTEQQYKEIKDRADAAKKAYQELGGVTSTKAQTEQEKQAKEAAKLAKQLQYDADQATIDAMVEGTDKKVAQIELDYKKRKDAIQQQEADLMAKQGGTLTDDQRKLFGLLHEGNADAYADAMNVAIFGDTDALAKEAFDRVKAEKDAWNEYLVEYGTFKERVKAITIKYNKAIADADTEAERKTLEAERDALLAEYRVQASEWAQELVDMSSTRLTKMLKDLQVELESKEAAYDALDSSNSASAEEYRNTINELRAKIVVLQDELGKVQRETKSGDWAKATQVFQNIGKAAEDAADGLEEFDGGLANMLRTIAQLSSSAINMIGAIQGAMTAFEEGLKAVEKASAILAIIGAAIQVVSTIAGIFKQNEQATRAATEAADEYAKALERIRNVELRASFSSIFGDDKYGEFAALLSATVEQKKKINDLAHDLEVLNSVGGTGVDYNAKTDAYWANNRAQANLIKRAEQADIQLVADMRSGWQKFWGTGWDNVDVKDLADFFDENGILNVDQLKAYYEEYGEYLDETTKRTVEALIEEGELYKDNLDALNGYMKDVFGEIGSIINDALADAFENGTDAAQAMSDAIGNILENLAKQIAYSSFISPLLLKAQESINDLNARKEAGELTEEEYLAELIKLGGWVKDEALKLQDNTQAFYQGIKDAGDESGIAVFDGENYSASASSKGFQTMSQETGSELNGRFTDIQGQTHRIAEAVEFCKSLHIENLSQVQSINATVAMIHNDTSLIAQHTRALALMQTDIASIRRSIDDGAI